MFAFVCFRLFLWFCSLLGIEICADSVRLLTSFYRAVLPTNALMSPLMKSSISTWAFCALSLSFTLLTEENTPTEKFLYCLYVPTDPCHPFNILYPILLSQVVYSWTRTTVVPARAPHTSWSPASR